MKSFFEEAFKRKADAKKAGNKALAQVWEIIINSAYGFWFCRGHAIACVGRVWGRGYTTLMLCEFFDVHPVSTRAFPS
jgi:hypothetical protein